MLAAQIMNQIGADSGLTAWLQWGADKLWYFAVALLSAIVSTAYFLGTTNRDLETLRKQVDVLASERASYDQKIADLLARISQSDEQTHLAVRKAFHDLRTELQVVIAANKSDTGRMENRIESHLERQDQRLDRFMERLIREKGNS